MRAAEWSIGVLLFCTEQREAIYQCACGPEIPSVPENLWMGLKQLFCDRADVLHFSLSPPLVLSLSLSLPPSLSLSLPLPPSLPLGFYVEVH